MTLYQLMCVDELIDETNAAWGRLKERSPLLDKYRDCRHFFELVSAESQTEREEIFSRLWDACQGKFNKGDNSLMILLCYQEFKTVFSWKMKFLLRRHDKIQLFQITVDIFLRELARKKTSICALQTKMNSGLEKMRERLLKEHTLSPMKEIYSKKIYFKAAANIMFQFTPPRGGRHAGSALYAHYRKVSIHAPARGATAD